MRKLLMATSALILLGAVPGFAQNDEFRVWRLLPDGQTMAAGDCVEIQPGTGAFEPSDQGDEPTPDVVQTECPTGMVPAESFTTGAIGDGDAGTELFEPSDQSDEPVPDVQD
ncbi:hypothetical protein [Chelativorans salis]|uniref:Uncharacterized protein n=1 Tax=Chelativorans salis TaxID=2978478 RepID=A0ABT2LUI3_9HYPH|nr:hypothetical protein [Chelativorans sp. EGI FJ00035]MCT7378186.1 hypothetical protein [Chelativorans sp. EGI FJ00035]